MDGLKGQDVKVYSVWVPILPSDAALTVGRATKYIPDERAAHFWDAEGELVRSFAPVLSLENGKAWDVYLLYDKDDEWADTPPKPIFWQEQLGISEETALDAGKLTAEIRRMLKTARN